MMDTIQKIIIALVISAFVLVSCSNTQNSWPGYRGEHGNGVSDEVNWDPNKLDTNAIIWKKELGKGHSGIVVEGKFCYSSGWHRVIENADTTETTTIYCLNNETGEEVWKFAYESEWINFPGPRSTPAISEDKIYNLGWQGDLHCLDANTGEVIWHRDVLADSLGQLVIRSSGYCTSPVIYNNTLLLSLGKHGVAFDKNTGMVKWKSDKNAYTSTSPMLIDYKTGKAALFRADSTMYAISIEDGGLLWKYAIKSGERNVEPIATVDNKVFLGGEYVDFKEKPKLVWKNRSIAPEFQTGVVINGYVYQFSSQRGNDHGLQCIDLSSGKVMWKEKMDRWGSLIAVGDKLVVLKGMGELAVVEAGSEKYKEISSCQALISKGRRAKMCWTSPTICDGKIYIRNFGGQLACIDLSL